MLRKLIIATLIGAAALLTAAAPAASATNVTVGPVVVSTDPAGACADHFDGTHTICVWG